MSTVGIPLPQVYRLPTSGWLLVVAAAFLGALGFSAGLRHMVGAWLGREEYSHGILIPFIAAFLIWQRRSELIRSDFGGSWAGVAVVAAAGLGSVIGRLAAQYTIQEYSLVMAIYGSILALTGLRTFKVVAIPLLILLFMVPLPDFLFRNFSAQLQLVSSQLGVWIIRLFGISVFVEGNVIDLGSYKLQVAEACSGLRYLFPLMTLGFIMAYFFKAPLWQRILLLLSSIPVTILMNSLRIGLIGVSVEYWGSEMAEGFLHSFEGWAVFMTSSALLVGEMILLTRLARDPRPWREVFGLEFPPPMPRDTQRRERTTPATFVAASAILAALALGVTLLPNRAEVRPQRDSFAEFPTRFGDWIGHRESIEQVYLDALKLDDYVMADYSRDGSNPVNFYVAWYDSQRAGQSAHSPRSCLPGGGWRINEISQVEIPGLRMGLQPLRVNRVLIEYGTQRQLVYYWFQQRGRVITNEYLVKWYLFVDSLLRNRTDGALVRLIGPLSTGEDVALGEKSLRDFAAATLPTLRRYVPD